MTIDTKIDTRTVNAKADLLGMAQRDTQLKRVGHEYKGPCPMPGCTCDKDGFSVQPDQNTWVCRHCTQGKYRTAIDYVSMRDGLDPHEYRDLTEICRRAMNGDPPTIGSSPSARPARYEPPAATPPGEAWQQQAAAFVATCERALWGDVGRRALAYLINQRGLSEATIKRYRLGYNEATAWVDPAAWGTPRDNPDKIWLPRGITIPCLDGRGKYWYIKIRQPVGDPKYLHVRGGESRAIFGAPDLRGAELAVLCEGEFDCMTLHQAIGDFAGCVTFGSSTNLPDLATWGVYLRGVKDFLEIYDNDQAGKEGAGRLAGMIRRVKPCLLPAGVKDVNEYHTGGGDLYQWIKPYLPPVDGDWRSWAAGVGAVITEEDYGQRLLEYAERAAANGDDLTFARAFARGMVFIGEDAQTWASWAECEYGVPASEILNFAKSVHIGNS